MAKHLNDNHFMTGSTGGNYLLKSASGNTGSTGSSDSTGITGSPSSATKKTKPALTDAIETKTLRPVGELQTSSDFGTEGNIIKEAKKIMRKLPKIKGAETSILSYMETMKDDAEKLIATTKEEYEPVALNCTAHTVAFERVANKTQLFATIC